MWVAHNNLNPLNDKIYSYNMPDRANRAPTAAPSSVTMNANTTYTFVADDFNFADSDAEDALEKVKIVTLPNSGSLTLSGAAVSFEQEIASSRHRQRLPAIHAANRCHRQPPYIFQVQGERRGSRKRRRLPNERARRRLLVRSRPR